MSRFTDKYKPLSEYMTAFPNIELLGDTDKAFLDIMIKLDPNSVNETITTTFNFWDGIERVLNRSLLSEAVIRGNLSWVKFLDSRGANKLLTIQPVTPPLSKHGDKLLTAYEIAEALYDYESKGQEGGFRGGPVISPIYLSYVYDDYDYPYLQHLKKTTGLLNNIDPTEYTKDNLSEEKKNRIKEILDKQVETTTAIKDYLRPVQSGPELEKILNNAESTVKSIHKVFGIEGLVGKISSYFR
jgi:hypothetical protein